MTTLAGRALYGDEVGKVFLNGKIDSLKRYKKLVGFVPQEDIMHRNMTVEEVFFFKFRNFLNEFTGKTLKFSAYTRLPREMSSTQKQKVVEDVLDMLGLQEIRYSQIGDEGNGEKHHCDL